MTTPYDFSPSLYRNDINRYRADSKRSLSDRLDRRSADWDRRWGRKPERYVSILAGIGVTGLLATQAIA